MAIMVTWLSYNGNYVKLFKILGRMFNFLLTSEFVFDWMINHIGILVDDQVE